MHLSARHNPHPLPFALPRARASSVPFERHHRRKSVGNFHGRPHTAPHYHLHPCLLPTPPCLPYQSPTDRLKASNPIRRSTQRRVLRHWGGGDARAMAITTPPHIVSLLKSTTAFTRPSGSTPSITFFPRNASAASFRPDLNTLQLANAPK